MTSKISFKKLLHQELKQFVWLTAIQAVIFILLFPFRILMLLAYRMRQNPGAEKILINTFNQNVGLSPFENILAAVLFGIICGVCLFACLHSSSSLDFYHSLPVKRGKLFAVRYFCGFLTYAVPWLLCQILTVLVGASFGALEERVAFEILLEALLCLMFFFV